MRESLLLLGGVWLASAAMAMWAFRRAPKALNCPMQWGLDRRPTWFAPRFFAILTPFAMVTILAAPLPLLGLSLRSEEDLLALIITTLIMTVVGLMFQAIYYWAVRRSLDS